MQVCPVPQALAQVPQLAASVCRFLQLPEQLVVPVAHAQAPAVQDWPVAHAVVQVPQCVESVCVFTQAPEHAVCPVVHEVVQLPLAQT